MCLAVLRRDGFVSLDADEKPGTVTTRPFRCAGTELWANVETKDRGEVARRFWTVSERSSLFRGPSSATSHVAVFIGTRGLWRQ